MDVRFWGPQFWATMEFIAFNYPLEPSYSDKMDTFNFYSSLAKTLPCASCRKHFQQLIFNDLPLKDALDNRDTLSKWMVEAHNRVNDRLGKPRMAFDVVEKKYQQMRGTCEMGQYSHPESVCQAICASSSPSSPGSDNWLSVKDYRIAIIILFSVALVLLVTIKRRG